MADLMHVAELTKGVLAWNEWRAADDPERADLRGADLRHADLIGANLSVADLTSADLFGADLAAAHLIGANLTGAVMWGTNMAVAELRGANLHSAGMAATVFAGSDLRDVGGLEHVHHVGPSEIAISTLYASEGDIPEAFLRGCGVPDDMIQFARSIGGAIQLYSCFISYSHKDEEFAQKLYIDLQGQGVRCWFAPEHMKMGDRIRQTIDDAIRMRDRLVLILSAESIESEWVEREVLSAQAEGKKRGRAVLFPVRVDNAVMETPAAWAADIQRDTHIGDFTQWKDHDAYQEAFQRVLRDLQSDDSAAAAPE